MTTDVCYRCKEPVVNVINHRHCQESQKGHSKMNDTTLCWWGLRRHRWTAWTWVKTPMRAIERRQCASCNRIVERNHRGPF